MGLTDDCETAKKLATRCKNWQILTVIRKKRLLVKKNFLLRKPKKKQKRQDSPRQGLNPDHGPQHGAVRCSTHWAAGNLSTFKLIF